MTKALRRPGKVPSAKGQPEAEADARPNSGMTPMETARYVAEFSAELAYLARNADLGLLAYLLDMARLEAIRAVQSGEKQG